MPAEAITRWSRTRESVFFPGLFVDFVCFTDFDCFVNFALEANGFLVCFFAIVDQIFEYADTSCVRFVCQFSRYQICVYVLSDWFDRF